MPKGDEWKCHLCGGYCNGRTDCPYPSPMKFLKVEEKMEEDTNVIHLGIQAAPFKYKEIELLEEIGNYLASTYSGHYVTQEDEAVVQALDLIFSSGRGEGFCVGNVLKYASRLGKKKSANERDDIMKIIHYSILTLYLYDKRKRKEMLADMDKKMPGPVGYPRSIQSPQREITLADIPHNANLPI